MLFCYLAKKMRPVRFIRSKDVFLLLLMRMKLHLGVRNLADSFRISLILISDIISSWLKGTTDTFGQFFLDLNKEL